MSNPQVLTEPKPIPPEIDRWNWGAFLLSWIWGVGNNTFIALLALIPIFGQLVMPFVLGAKGSRWAWRNGRWDGVEHFKRVQRQWAIWGAIIWLGSIVLFGGRTRRRLLSLQTFRGLQARGVHTSSQPGSDKSSRHADHGRLSERLDQLPITRLRTAVLSFSASGPKAAGTVFLEAVKKDGAWAHHAACAQARRPRRRDRSRQWGEEQLDVTRCAWRRSRMSGNSCGGR